MEFDDCDYSCQQIPSRTREEKNLIKNRDAIEKTRLAARHEHFERYQAVDDIIKPIQSSSCIDDVDRFNRDYTQDQKRTKEFERQRMLARAAAKHEQQVQYERAIEKRREEEAEEMAKVMDQCSKHDKNNESTLYNPVTNQDPLEGTKQYTAQLELDKDREFRREVVVVGSLHAGKSSIIQRFVNDQFNSNTCSTVQAGFFEKTLDVEGTKIALEIWDTAGQEKFHSLVPVYYRDASAAIIIYDVTDASSYTKSKQWINEIIEVNGPNLCMMLMGNKYDLQAIRVVPQSDATEYCESMGISYIEGSAKTGYNVNKMFYEVASRLYHQSTTIDQVDVRLEGETREKSKCCT
ncbi:ras-related protein RHN1 [Histomonas meleagridis]|uniref:ras-related protein RHN1 n=1 Tax=Histomonas meleagridis TaxID=135588 RepID=UPI003559B338|nr:ras-related protein RHN1 [Histomonas meleagridis]KAH0803701.1 ras-related protein RHN1 [Histomonas meleagridis]